MFTISQTMIPYALNNVK